MLKRLKTEAIHSTEAEIKDEPMLFSASPEFAMESGGPLTRKIVNQLAVAGHFDDGPGNVVIDTRVHMLKPGWIPAIGGWHCDAVPRGADGQPDLGHPVIPSIRHYLSVVDCGTGALTEFWDNPPVAKALPKKASPGKNLWGEHSELINLSLRMVWPYGGQRERYVTTVSSGDVYEFDATDYHRAIPATGHGWRFFFRASVNTLTKGPLNEIRKQVQVYMPHEDFGW